MESQTVVTTQAAMPASVVFGDLVFDLMKRRVSCKGKRLPLTGMEYDILAFIASYAQKKERADRRKLYNKLYIGTQYQPDGNVINVFVSKIRKKLKKAESDCAIETYNRSGYEIFYKKSDPE